MSNCSAGNSACPKLCVQDDSEVVFQINRKNKTIVQRCASCMCEGDWKHALWYLWSLNTGLFFPCSNRLFLYSYCFLNRNLHLTKSISLVPLQRLHKYCLVTHFHIPLFIILTSNCFIPPCNIDSSLSASLFLKRSLNGGESASEITHLQCLRKINELNKNKNKMPRTQ